MCAPAQPSSVGDTLAAVQGGLSCLAAADAAPLTGSVFGTVCGGCGRVRNWSRVW